MEMPSVMARLRPFDCAQGFGAAAFAGWLARRQLPVGDVGWLAEP